MFPKALSEATLCPLTLKKCWKLSDGLLKPTNGPYTFNGGRFVRSLVEEKLLTQLSGIS